MKLFQTLPFCLLTGLVPLAAQTTNTYPFPASGNVGIGTTSPTRLLSLYAQYPEIVLKSSANSGGTGGSTLYFANATSESAGWLNYNHTYDYLTIRVNEAERVRITSSGNVGIGTTSPAAKLQVTVSVSDTGMILDDGGNNYNPAFTIDRNGAHRLRLTATSNTGTIYGMGGNGLSFGGDNGTQHLLITPGGNVGIGTTSPSHKLAVAGTIRAFEVIVNTGWSDYVFKPGYRLAPLSEVEAHIQAHGTLPGVPSEAEVAKEGVSLGDMQARLLAKVEELTLHVIAQEKRIARLEQENNALRSRSSRP